MQIIEIESSPSVLPPPKKQSGKNANKQTKPERACDFCRKRKTKCDGPWSKDHICSNCRSSKIGCTYVETSKPRGPPKAYITTLEDKVEQTEQLLKRLRPDLDLTSVIGPSIPRGSWKSEGQEQQPMSPSRSQRSSGSPEINVAIRPGMQNTSNRPSSMSPPHEHNQDVKGKRYANSDSEDEGATPPTRHDRYPGKSSDAGLIHATVKVKQEYDHDYEPHLNLEFDVPDWEIRCWAELKPRRPYNYPPPDLCEDLIELYFKHSNDHFPLLHRPTFDAQYRSSLHTRDRAFAAMFFALLALACRFSNDPRIYEKPSSPTLSCGWKFFTEAVKYRPTAMAPACLFDLQRFAILSSFLRWTRHAPASWNMTALGIRLAQDLGVHRKKWYQPYPTVEDELWKRAFWLLVAYDRVGSASLGRPCCSREEDIDAELPLEVDDEYWIDADPKRAFQQPPGKPSRISAINSFIKMTQMMAFSMRTIYCIDKTKVLLGLVGPNWREQVIQQLNEAMDEWTSTLPDHLRWNPNIEDPLFSNQSATLYTAYYLLLLLVYRPFIPPPNAPRVDGKPAITEEYPFPALAICTSVAKAGVRILETQLLRGLSNIPNLIAVAHLCGAILLMNIWEAKKQDEKADTSDLVRDVKICLRALETCADRWESAADFLRGLRAGLPSDTPIVPSQAHPEQAAALKSKPVAAPRKPPMPPGATDYPHERAMQPPRLTDGWHWFSQVGIGPTYADNPQIHDSAAESTSVGVGVNKLPETHREKIALSVVQPQPHSQPLKTQCSVPEQQQAHSNVSTQSYSRSVRAQQQQQQCQAGASLESDTTSSPQVHQPFAQMSIPSTPSSTLVAPSNGDPRTRVYSPRGQLPWWVEQAVVGRPAYLDSASDPQASLNFRASPARPQPFLSYMDRGQDQPNYQTHSFYDNASSSSNNHNNYIHAGGSIQDWQQLAEPRNLMHASSPTSDKLSSFSQAYSPPSASGVHSMFIPGGDQRKHYQPRQMGYTQGSSEHVRR